MHSQGPNGAGLPHGVADQREGDDGRGRQHRPADDPRQRLGRPEQPVGQSDGHRRHQRAGQHPQRDAPGTCSAVGGRRRVDPAMASMTKAAVPVSTVMKDRLTAMLRQLSRRIRKTSAPAATWVTPDRPGRQQQQAEHHRQFGSADQQRLPADLDLQGEQFAGQECDQQDQHRPAAASRAVDLVRGDPQHRTQSTAATTNISAATTGKTWPPVYVRRACSAAVSSVVIANPSPRRGRVRGMPGRLSPASGSELSRARCIDRMANYCSLLVDKMSTHG